MLQILQILQLIPMSDIINSEAFMNLFRITKEDKIKSGRALEKELPKLKKLVSGNVFSLITALLKDTSHDTEVIMDPTSAEEYVSPNQAAIILQASRPYIRKLIDERVLHAHKIGSHYKIKLSEVFALKESWEPKRKESFGKLHASLDKVINDTEWE
jgi:excisionase family DNA binding protein